MGRQVYAFLPADDDAAMRFAVRRADGWRLLDEEEARLSTEDSVTVFAPGVDVALLRAALPARSEAEARRAAPYAVEDELGEAVDQVHAALGPKPESGGERWIAVVSEDVMEAWRARLSARGLDNARLVAEHNAPPDETSAVVDLGPRVLIVAGGRRFALDADTPDDALKLLADGAETIHGGAVARRLGRPGVSLEPGDDALVRLAEWAEGRADLIDLRQGAFAPRRRLDLSGVKGWRTAGALAAAVAVGYTAAAALEARAIGLEADRLASAAQAAHARAFPGTPMPTGGGPVSVSARGTSLDFLEAAAALYAALDAVDGAELQSLRFDRDRAELQAAVAYRDYGDDIRLRDAVAAAGYGADLGDARQAGGRVLGQVVVRPGA